MSGYILCSGALAEHPFLLREMNLMIYSAEELCYYIYHDYPLIEDDFFSDELLSFLEDELGHSYEAKVLRDMKEENQGLVLMLMSVLRLFHYYNETELKEFQLKVEEFRHNPPAKRRAMKADFLLERGHYLSAIQIYHLFDSERKDPALGADFYMLVNQHMAIGYVRLGLNNEAMLAYMQAFEAQPTEELTKQIYQFSLFTNIPLNGKIYNFIKPEWEAAWRGEFEEIEAQGSLLATTGPTVGMFTKDSMKRKEALKTYIDGIKKNYRTAIS